MGSRRAAGENIVQEAVDGQVGITADRGGEVAIAIAGQGVVAVFIRSIDGALQRPQHGEVDRPLFRPARRPGQELLQLEAALQVCGGKAEFANEVAQGADLRFAGRLVDAAEERNLLREEHPRRRLVGREHELLDDLVALGVLDHPRADHPAGVVQIDLHFRQAQTPSSRCPSAASAGSWPTSACRPRGRGPCPRAFAARRPYRPRTGRPARRSAACCCGWQRSGTARPATALRR